MVGLRLPAVSFLTLVVGALACGDGDDVVNGITPTFDATITGDLDLTLSGTAIFGTETSEGEEFGFAIALIRGDVESTDFDLIAVGRESMEAPGTGTFTIHSFTCTDCTAQDFAAVFAFTRPNGDFAFFSAEEGSFTITSASSERLEGRFDFTATILLATGTTAENVTVRGTFTAIRGELPSISQ